MIVTGYFPSQHPRLVKALQHLTQGLARHHWLFSSGAATRSPRTFHGAPGCHLTWGNAEADGEQNRQLV